MSIDVAGSLRIILIIRTSKARKTREKFKGRIKYELFPHANTNRNFNELENKCFDHRTI